MARSRRRRLTCGGSDRAACRRQAAGPREVGGPAAVDPAAAAAVSARPGFTPPQPISIPAICPPRRLVRGSGGTFWPSASSGRCRMVQIAFVTLLLGLVTGAQPVEVSVSGPVAAVELRLDGVAVGTLS